MYNKKEEKKTKKNNSDVVFLVKSAMNVMHDLKMILSVISWRLKCADAKISISSGINLLIFI